MPDITLEDVNTSAQNAQKAFEAMKTDILPLGKKFEDLEGTTKDTFKKMEKSISDGMQATQNAEAKAQAALEGQKALEQGMEKITTALNRHSPGATKDDAKAFSVKRNKLFNDFVRLTRGNGKLYFDEYLVEKSANDPELKAMSVDSDPNGGFLTMPEWGGFIQTKVFESSPMRQLANVTTVGSDTLEIVVDYDESDANWVSERQTRSNTTTPTIGKINIYANELEAMAPLTQKFLDDAVIDAEAWILNKIADKFARKEATAFITGSGSGQPKGIMSYTSGTTLSSGQVEQVVTGNASAVTLDGFVNTQNALKEPYQANATWLYQRATNALVMLIKDGESRPIFNMNYDKNVGLEPSLLGRPVRFAADVAAVTASALAAAYGDFKQAYQIIDRNSLRLLRDPYSSKPNVLFYATRRVGGETVNFEAYKVMKIST